MILMFQHGAAEFPLTINNSNVLQVNGSSGDNITVALWFVTLTSYETQVICDEQDFHVANINTGTEEPTGTAVCTNTGWEAPICTGLAVPNLSFRNCILTFFRLPRPKNRNINRWLPRRNRL